MKLDLLMWTLNSSATLPYTLASIKKAIPEKYVNKKIIIDGYSEDHTLEIAEKFGWNTVISERGIGKQANIGLSLVETEFFASFEHDIILCPDWFYRIKDTIQPKDIAVSQGVRVSSNPVLRAIENYSLKKDIRYTSIDNNIYRTKIIREIGGFAENYPASTDRELQDRVLSNGYRWVVNKNIVSDHIKLSIRKDAEHVHKLALLKDYREDNRLMGNLKRFMFSPIRGLQIAKSERCPLAVLGYPFWRFWKLKTSIRIRCTQ